MFSWNFGIWNIFQFYLVFWYFHQILKCLVFSTGFLYIPQKSFNKPQIVSFNIHEHLVLLKWLLKLGTYENAPDSAYPSLS